MCHPVGKPRIFGWEDSGLLWVDRVQKDADVKKHHEELNGVPKVIQIKPPLEQPFPFVKFKHPQSINRRFPVNDKGLIITDRLQEGRDQIKLDQLRIILWLTDRRGQRILRTGLQIFRAIKEQMLQLHSEPANWSRTASEAHQLNHRVAEGQDPRHHWRHRGEHRNCVPDDGRNLPACNSAIRVKLWRHFHKDCLNTNFISGDEENWLPRSPWVNLLY